MGRLYAAMGEIPVMQTVATSLSVLGGVLALVVWDVRRAAKLDREIRRELSGQADTQRQLPAEERGEG